MWLKIGNKDHPNEENVPLDKEMSTIGQGLARFSGTWRPANA